MRPLIYGRCSRAVALAFAGAVLSCTAAAQDNAAAIEERIDAVFDVVPQNPLELAVPLSRRALARRVVENEEGPASTGAVGPAGNPAEIRNVDPSATAGTLPSAGVSSPLSPDQAGEPGEESAAARLPRSRPGELPTAAPSADGEPLDLVAAAAAPAPTKDTEPQQLLPAPATPPPATPSGRVERITGDATPPRVPPAFVTAAVGASQSRAGEAMALTVPKNCLPLNKVADMDGDFSRNRTALTGMCVTQQTFRERRRPWTIQTVHSGRPGPLWVVMHDDEATAFDNAVAALKTYGGKFMTVDTGGNRNQDGIDPNRNFSADGIGCAKLGSSASPRFSGLFREAFVPAQPVVVLHNNAGKPSPTGGLGHVAMDTVPKEMRVWKASDPDRALSGKHTLVLLAAVDPSEPAVQDWAEGLSGKGVNVVVEPVTKKNADCSLSNFAVLAGQRNYFNVTVDKDDGEAQRRIVELIMSSFFTVAAR